MKPEFIDNRRGNTLAAALNSHLDWLSENYARPLELSIATGYFNIGGFSLLAEKLESLPRIRLLLGAEPTPPPSRPERRPGDPRGENFETKLVGEAVGLNYQGLIHDRDRLEFSRGVDAAISRLLALLESGRVEVRRYEKNFMHGKAFIFGDEEGVIAGSSNFTAAGITSNIELNLGRYDPTPVGLVKKWFDDLWAEAAPFDLAAVYAARFREYSPYDIYLRVLWEMYGRELEEEKGTEAVFKLTTFQNDGVWRSRRIMERYNGVLIADGVGLGKTFIAGEIIQDAVKGQRQRALLISPAALRDGMWSTFLDKYQLYVENISYEQLANDRQLGGDEDHLKCGRDEYSMVVIDESQAFRNPETRRAQALRRLLMGKPPKKLVLLTATPVNNSLWDLYYLLTLFVGHDGVFADRGIRSLKQRFSDASQEDPDELRPDMLFDILDEVTVRRTRHFVKKYYAGEHIKGAEGREFPVRFPTPHVKAIKYSLDEVLPVFFDEIKEALAPAEGEPQLSMARYSPSRYSRAGAPDESQLALVGLIRSGLLKRFESSVYAFARTLAGMIRNHESFMEALERGYVPTPEALDEWTNTDNDEEWEQLEELLVSTGSEPVAAYDIDELKSAVGADLALLRSFHEKAAGIDRAGDPKLARLGDSLLTILQNAEGDGIGEQDERNKRKVIIFSYFADTVDWIEEYLFELVDTDDRFAPYRGRIASVVGHKGRHEVSREKAVFGFAPMSTQAPAGRDDDNFDILITTDVLAEGVNLQQCRNIINYDLPWNPMRMVQRHGRIDRIGSPHDDVYLYCYFPDRRLDELLELENRVRRKLAQAAASIGVESEVIPGGAISDVVFAQTTAEIEKLEREDASIFETAGEDPSAHSGEEYRQELRRALQARRDEIMNLPWAAGSGMAQGSEKGHFFCARIGERLVMRFVPLGGEGVDRNTLKCLQKISCNEATPRYLPADLRESVYGAWEKARRDIYDEWMFSTDPANIQPSIRPLFLRAAEHLRQNPPAGVTQIGIDEAVEALEAPWGRRHEKAIREVLDQEGLESQEISAALMEKVQELGLQPFIQPEPLPVIGEEEIHLICWMAVDRAGVSSGF
ncbi:MAG: helicase-related protein [Acidithiobacillus ferrivorans]